MGSVQVDGQTVVFNDECSLKNFTNVPFCFPGHEKELDGITIYASCFCQSVLDTDVFPADVKNLTLVYCNLDNVNIPAGVTVVEFRPAIRFKVQNDLRDWELDGNNLPVKVCGEKAWIMAGCSVDPADIPATPAKSIDLVKKGGG